MKGDFLMIYLSSFKLSDKSIKNPNIYPYNVFHRKDIDPFIFAPITVLYGNNGSGKSTILNIIANKLMLTGKEYATSNSFGIVDYCGKFSSECQFSYGEDEFGNVFRKFSENSRFIKSEDILYEIKKIQQRQILSDGMEYDYMKNGHSQKEAEDYFQTQEGRNQIEYIEFAQEKYSNGETAMQFFEEYLLPDTLYLLDEPEVSLSPANQVLLAKEINKLARLLSCQFIIATHSPFMLGTLNAKIYNIDKDDYSICEWYELENVRYFYDFFKKHEKEFE
ncbi:MAG: AAA family ATPase [Coprococcus sp.]|jgi:predicted ATPase